MKPSSTFSDPDGDNVSTCTMSVPFSPKDESSAPEARTSGENRTVDVSNNERRSICAELRGWETPEKFAVYQDIRRILRRSSRNVLRLVSSKHPGADALQILAAY